MTNKNKEVRRVRTKITRAAEENSRKVEGYAMLFNVPSDGLDFTEVINSGAITQDTINKSNVFCLLNHDKDRGILGRSNEGKGTLMLKVDDKGLYFSVDLPNTALGDEVLEYISRGEIDSCSFAFTIEKDDWVSQQKTDGKKEYIHTITQIYELYDVSVVYDAAYSETEVNLRGLDAIKDKEKQERKAALNAYFAELESKL